MRGQPASVVSRSWACVAMFTVVGAVSGCQDPQPTVTSRAADEALGERFKTQLRVAELRARAAKARTEKQYDTARDLLKEAVGLDGADGRAQHLLGLVYFEQGDLYNAAIHLDVAARVLNDRYEPCYNLGKVMEAGSQYDDAIRYYQRALARYPDHLSSLENLVRVRVKTGCYDEDTLRLINRCLEREQRPQWSNWLERQATRLRERLGPQKVARSSKKTAQSAGPGQEAASED